MSQAADKQNTRAARQIVRFLFLQVDPAWRRLPAEERSRQKDAFIAAIARFRGRLLVRTYSLMGTRGDADLLFWHAGPDLEAVHAFAAAIFETALGGYLRIAHSYLSMTRKSPYDFPGDARGNPGDVLRPAGGRYLYVYPFVKSRGWYALPAQERQALMQEHVEIGRRYPGVTVNTTYSFGLDDQEFVVTFENDDPASFLDLVMEMRSSAASQYTAQDTPVLTGLQMTLRQALDALGGAPAGAHAGERGDTEYVAVAAVDDVPVGGGVRAYLRDEAVAVWRVADAWYAVSDRCPHGRASLSEGTLHGPAAEVQCPWHEGTFCLKTGRVTSGPPRRNLRVFEVKVDRGLVWLRDPGEAGLRAAASVPDDTTVPS